MDRYKVQDGYKVHGADEMTNGVMDIPRGSLLLIEHGRGMQVELWDGKLWITQERDSCDYVIGPGRAFGLEREGLCLVYAVHASRLTLTAPVPAHYAKRISLELPRSARRVLYERSRERCGWLAGIGHRLARLWINSYALYSNPTAAL